jgi:hypothetical protein
VDYLTPVPDGVEEVTQAGRLTLVPTPPVAQPPMFQELSDDTMVEFSLPGDPEEASDKTVTGIINFVDEPEQENSTLTGLEIEKPMAPMEPGGSSEPVAFQELPDAANSWDAVPMTPQPPLVEMPPTVDAPNLFVVAPPTAAAREDLVDWSVPVEEKEETIRVRAIRPQTAPLPTVAAAAEFYALASYFKTATGIPSTQLHRLESQQICFAIELEFQERLATVTPAFWPNRAAALIPLWDPASPKGDFHPDLIRCWETLVSAGSAWPTSEKLPLVTFRNALKILAMTSEASGARLSNLEAGLWIFLFGQERTIGAVALHNGLALPEMGQEQVADAFLRLCRVHRLKSQLVNPSTLTSAVECEELRSHAEVLFRFSKAWMTRNGSGF